MDGSKCTLTRPCHGTARHTISTQLGFSESRFKGGAHIFRSVLKDVAVFKVRRSARFDHEAATMPAVVLF